ncbi:MAG: hypothetical protein ACK4PR_04755 [Gammaproteobacteria bacterium]
MDTNDQKSPSKFSYEIKFIIILVFAIIGIMLLYFGMEYCFNKVSPQSHAAPLPQSGSQTPTVIEE